MPSDSSKLPFEYQYLISFHRAPLVLALDQYYDLGPGEQRQFGVDIDGVFATLASDTALVGSVKTGEAVCAPAEPFANLELKLGGGQFDWNCRVPW
ncbi:MAG TPA: hypothetical protein VLE22_25055 [Bryobacteraceae bacterium]|nr:hypothetical protein [Bryobacteraceae bacterium]